MSCLLRSAKPNKEGVVQIHLGIVAMRAEFFHQTEQWYKIMQERLKGVRVCSST